MLFFYNQIVNNAYNIKKGDVIINKVFDFIAENNIQPEALFALVEKVQQMDLSNEDSIRQVIRDVSKLANKPVDKNQENKIIQEIMKNGINDNIFDML